MQPKLTEQEQARNLYFETELTQAQIAQIVGVTSKTVSAWATEGRWKRLKALVDQTPTVMMNEMYDELAEISEAIKSREPGKRFATPQEAETRRKMLASIKFIGEKQSAGTHAEVLLRLKMMYLQRENPDLVKPATLAADRFLKGEKRLGRDKKFIPYKFYDKENEETLGENNAA